MLTEEVAKWAYGDDWSTLAFRAMPERWNERHVDIFEMYSSDCIEETSIKIKAAYAAKT